MTEEIEPFEFKWKAYSHIYHPYGDLLWHLFWGVITGASLIYAFYQYDYWFFIISLGAIIFFFHPKFYEPKLMEIEINQTGVKINNKFYNWNMFYGFEIFDNGFRKFIFLLPNNFSLGLHFPLEEFFVSEKEIKEILSKFLKEYKNSVPIFDRVYRAFFL